ncbi:carotenoid cleavage dioxygenase 1 [Streptomyces laurentii]|uniref:Carotenoid cleavage dioxygenase 1 n=1 Tax=Streptomyces laurentii TaxID=39478 RepID=A0A169P806_STRLU|nr:carotenoid cleavage dioxygenase 1 [Streptomyces laurentii]
MATSSRLRSARLIGPEAEAEAEAEVEKGEETEGGVMVPILDLSPTPNVKLDTK